MKNSKQYTDGRIEPTSSIIARRPYSEPRLMQSGSIPEITGGPSGGTIDTLAGGTGGFQTSTS